MSTEPFHRWYTSVMAFSPSLVRDAISELGCDRSGWLLDPFCGTGTSLVESALKGVPAIGVDSNPFSCLCSKAKTRPGVDPDRLEAACREIIALADAIGNSAEHTPQALPHVVRKGWVSSRIWSSASTLFHLAGSIRSYDSRRLLRLAIISAVKEHCANVAFGPEIYKRSRRCKLSLRQAILGKVGQIATDLRSARKQRGWGNIRVIHGDSRDLGFLDRIAIDGKIRWIITSPPYPTEHDYSRITRIELELGRFVRSYSDLRKIKRMQLRSNSKTVYVDDEDWRFVSRMSSVTRLVRMLERRASQKTYGFARQYPKVVGNYFGGLRRHLASVADVIVPGGRALYVLSEQRSYFGVHIPTTQILEEIACERLRGFRCISRKTVKIRRGTRGTTRPIYEEAMILERR